MSHDAFSDPATRMLLSADGSTTRLLEAVAGPLRLRVLHQAIGTAAAVPEPIRAALRLDAEAQIINRCSALMDGRLQPVSLNHVVAPYAPATQLGRIASGTDSGIGPELSRQRVEHCRELLACGLARWPDGSARQFAAVKIYLICQGDEPVMYLREMFNPAVISPATADAVTVLPALRAAPAPAPPLLPPRSGPLPASRQPPCPDPHETGGRREKLSAMSGLVTATDCGALLELTALAAVGESFVIHVGDRGADLDQRARTDVEGRHALIRLLASAAGFGMGLPVAAVGASAGRLAEDPPTRPERLFDAYLDSAAMLHALHNADQDTNTRWLRSLQERLLRPPGRRCHPQAEATLAALDFAARFGMPGSGWPRTYVSHEARVLDYEHALLRAGAGGAFATSGHLLSIGDRWRDLEGGHIAFAAAIANPVAVRLGPSATSGEVLELCRRLNPARTPGKLSLIVGMGGGRLSTVLPGLLRAVAGEGHPVVWTCDPLPADTVIAHPGCEPLRMDDVLADITAFFDAHSAAAGTHPGGLYLEATAGVFDEVAGGREAPTRSGSASDPRLHPLQALECVLHAADLANGAPRAGSASAEKEVTYRKWARRFDLYDADGDGRISRSDFERFVTQVASAFVLPETSPKVRAALSAQRRLWASLSERAGSAEQLTRRQFVTAAQALRSGDAERFHSLVRSHVDTAVALADVHGDGRIEPATFISFMTAIGVPRHHAETMLPTIAGADRIETGTWSEMAFRYFTSADPRDPANALLGEVPA